MQEKPRARRDQVRAVTYRRGPFAHRLFSNGRRTRGRVSRRLSKPGFLARRWSAARACFGAAIGVLACAAALALFMSPAAEAGIDAENRALSETADLQGGWVDVPRSASIEVPAVQQYPELPTGCESVALTNALLSFGFDLSKTDIADTWLPRSDEDFVNAFMGDPRSTEGHSCMPPAIVLAADAYLDAQGSDLQAVDITGSSFEDVLAEAAAGNPVIVWCTIALDEPGNAYRSTRQGDRVYRLYSNSHCVVVSGYDLDSGTVQVSDSLAGQVTYGLEILATRYYELGSQAVVVK